MMDQPDDVEQGLADGPEASPAPAPLDTLPTAAMNASPGGNEIPAAALAAPVGADVQPSQGEAVAGTRRRRWAVALAVVAVLLAGAAFGGLKLWHAMARRPVVTALVASSGEFSDAIDDVAASQDLDAAVAAAKELPARIDDVEDQLAALDRARASATRDAAMEVLTSQREVLASIATVAELSAADLGGWPDLADEIAGSTEDLAQATARLEAVDPAAAEQLATDGTQALDALGSVIAASVTENAVASVQDVMAQLTDASRLRGLQRGGAAAAEAADGMAVALDILAGNENHADARELLTLQAAFLTELAPLDAITPETIDRWAGQGAVVARSGAAMAAGLDGDAAERAALTRDLRDMRTNIDDVVTHARRALREWRGEVRRVRRAQDANLADLNDYETEMRAQLDRYDDLRDQTADFTNRIETEFVTYDEAYDAFYDGISQREVVREAMNGITPPDAARSTHLALTGVIDDALAAMSSAVDGLYDSQYCYFCYYRDTPGWERFQAESDRITDSFATAIANWESAVGSERSRLNNIELPKPPRV